MKKGVVFLAGLLIAAISVAQNQNMDEIKVTAPTYRGEFFESINDVLNNRVQYPAKSKKAGLQGTEVIRFTVTVDGKLTDYHVVNSVSPEIDAEVIRLLKATSGNWTPGTVNGNPFEMQKEVFVAFKLRPSVNFVAQATNYLKKGNRMLYVKNNVEKALKYYSMGINFLPSEKILLVMRGFCNYKLGNEDAARSDWERITANSTDSIIKNYAREIANLEEYKELSQALHK